MTISLAHGFLGDILKKTNLLYDTFFHSKDLPGGRGASHQRQWVCPTAEHGRSQQTGWRCGGSRPRAGHWLSIRCRYVDANWRASFAEILERESALLALDEPCNRVVVYTPSAFDTDASSGYQLRDLTLVGGTAADYQPLAMALA